MNIFCQSIDFRNCPSDVRSELSLDVGRQRLFLRNCHGSGEISDALILNTCNRLEFYLYAKKRFDIAAFIDGFISLDYWRKNKQTFCGVDTVKHLFSIACGVESQIIGENEILSQLKNAYSFAIRNNSAKFMFHRLLHASFRAAKAVRTRTNINTGALSIAQAGVGLALDVADVNPKALIIGSGANAGLVLKHLIRKNITDITIAARNNIAAERLIETSGMGGFVSLDNLQAAVSQADIIFAATCSPNPLLTKADFESIIKNRTRPLFMVDISIPQNIDGELAKIDNVKLFDIDSLQKKIDENNLARQAEIPKAQAIIDEHVAAFSQWLDTLSVMPAVKRLQDEFLSLARAEAQKYACEFAEPEKLTTLAEGIARKLLHGPISFLKNGDEQTDDWPDGEKVKAVELVEKMFLDREAYR